MNLVTECDKCHKDITNEKVFKYFCHYLGHDIELCKSCSKKYVSEMRIAEHKFLTARMPSEV